MLEKIKTSLRVDGIDLDIEIQDLINAAVSDLKLSGINVPEGDITDPLLIRAITIYCKMEFSFDGQEALRFKDSYNMLKGHLSMSIDYYGGVADGS